MLLDKNPNNITQSFDSEVKKLLKINAIHNIICTEPFDKISFFEKITTMFSNQIIYLDFDLLFCGYIKSGLLNSNDKLFLYCPTEKSWIKEFEGILRKILEKNCIVIIDSLNGFYRLFDEKESGRLVNFFIMFLGYLARETDSLVMFSSVARLDEENWVLIPSGRKLIEAKTISKIFLKRKNGKLALKYFE